MSDPESTLPPKVQQSQAEAKKGWEWLQLHPLVLGFLLGVIVGLGAGAYIFHG